MITTNPSLDKPKKFNVDTNAQQEFFVGGNDLISDFLYGLDHRADKVSQEFTEETVARMLRDPEIKKCDDVLKNGILAEGIGFYPALRKPLPLTMVKNASKKGLLEREHKKYEESKKYADFLTRSLKKLDKPFLKTVESMLEALYLGNKVAEKVYSEVFDPVLNRKVLIVTKLKVKPRNSINMVVDNKSNLVGIRGLSIRNKKREVITLPMEKFMVLTFEERDEDPRGLSKLDAVYNAWYLKTLVFPEYMKWLQQCALPSLIGVMPPNSEKRAVVNPETGELILDSKGQPVYINNADEMLDSLVKMKNSSVMVVPNEADVKPIGGNNVSGDPFRSMIDFLNKEMEMALLLQTLATSDSRHNTRAASQTHISVLDQHIFRLKQKVIDMVLYYYVKPMLELNFPNYDEELIPKISMGDSERRNWAEDLNSAVNAWKEGYLSKSQRIGMDFQLSLDERGDDDEDPTYEKPDTKPQPSNPQVKKV